ncbi:MAG: hypothetical protein ABJA94_10405 [Rhodoglobus sp.]
MTITPGLAAELDLLTQALDLPGTDLAENLTRLAAAAQAGVDSYLGLSVEISVDRSQFDLCVLVEGTEQSHIRTSLLVPLSFVATDEYSPAAFVAVILYAAIPGAFTDLAADLAWSTGRPPADFRVNEHQTLPSSYIDSAPLAAISSINQALGVLIGHGVLPEQAERDLHARAVIAGTDLLSAATAILATLTPPEVAEP